MPGFQARVVSAFAVAGLACLVSALAPSGAVAEPAGAAIVAIPGSAAIVPTWQPAPARVHPADPTSTASLRPSPVPPRRGKPIVLTGQEDRLPSRPTYKPARFPVGVWVDVGEDCPASEAADDVGLKVGSTKATAGDAVCRYKSVRPDGASWRVTAICSDAGETWRSDIQLTEASGRLRWESQRGRATYRRCSMSPTATGAIRTAQERDPLWPRKIVKD
jgi:hypothetical protein